MWNNIGFKEYFNEDSYTDKTQKTHGLVATMDESEQSENQILPIVLDTNALEYVSPFNSSYQACEMHGRPPESGVFGLHDHHYSPIFIVRG